MLDLLSSLGAIIEAVLSVFEAIGLFLDGLEIAVWVAEKAKAMGRWLTGGCR